MARPPRPPATEIECVTLHGGRARHPASEFRFRPAAYGIAVRGREVLLGRSAFSGLWDPPGGAVAAWEDLAEGLRREFREETGVEPENPRLFRVIEGYFSIFGRAYHSLRFFYLVDLPAGLGETALRPEPGELAALAWRDPSSLRPEECAPGVWEVISEARAAAARGTSL